MNGTGPEPIEELEDGWYFRDPNDIDEEEGVAKQGHVLYGPYETRDACRVALRAYIDKRSGLTRP